MIAEIAIDVAVHTRCKVEIATAAVVVDRCLDVAGR